ncbi:MAG: DUF444 family protein [Armatimonadetes bacterium]|nr:DUF444 family protein [Armatimonadota bacterium]MDW8027237.1 DUF444 family protein [Armatimonadota bacterium]
MVERIERDVARFRDIVKGKIRQNLRKFITNTELIGRQGKTIVSIPVPQIEIPHFTYRWRDAGGVGQGEGEEGDILWVEGQEGEGQRGAGFLPGLHPVEVEITLEELVELLGQELELPRLEPKSYGQMQSEKPRYKSIRRVGPESLRHFKRTFRQALRRQMLSGTYNHENPVIIPVHDDFRYRSFEYEPQPESKAVIFFMMDVSGSMGDEQKEIVRITAFWIDQWVRRHYKGVERRYIVHDAAAREVPEDLFYRLRESGGTKISSAYKLCSKLIDEHYSPTEWNIYAFHFSDGDNWEEDDADAFEVLGEKLLPQVNLFGYGQVYSHWGSGRFIYDLADEFANESENLRLTEIRSKEYILDAIRNLLGKNPSSESFRQRPQRRRG